MNILEAVSIRLPCTACGQFYDVPLNDILISNQMLEQGCPLNDETECPPVFQTRLVGREVLGEFVRAWNHLEENIQRNNGVLVISARSEQSQGRPACAAHRSAPQDKQSSIHDVLVPERDRGLDQTLRDTFPCSDALSSIPDPPMTSVGWP